MQHAKMARLHHIALGARDVTRVAEFYANLFELKKLAKNEDDEGKLRSIWLSLEPGILMIEKSSEPFRHVEGIGRGPFLIAFVVSERERGLIEERLRALHVKIQSRTAFTSYALDPEGNRFAFSHYS